MSRQLPLYAQLSDRLRQSIAEGVFGLDSLLPTELELCATYQMSRHTVRDALRVLEGEGLIERKRGAGTRVINNRPLGPFSQEWGDIGDIMQYARDTRLMISGYGPASDGSISEMALDVNQSWMMVTGLRARLEGGLPLARTTICVEAALMPARDIAESWPQTLGEYIAAHSGIQAVRIEQEISAMVLTREAASALGEPKGAPALRTLRRYIDGNGQVFLASMSIHPSDRFSYKMSIER